MRAAEQQFATLILDSEADCHPPQLSQHPRDNSSARSRDVAGLGAGSMGWPSGHTGIAALLSQGQIEASTSAKARIFQCCY